MALFFLGAGEPGMQMPMQLILDRGAGSVHIYLEAAGVVTTLILASRRQRQPAADDAHLQGSSVLAQPLDIQRERFAGVLGRLVEGVALGVQSRQLGRVDVIAALALGLEHELHLGRYRHMRQGSGPVWVAAANCSPPHA